MFLTILSRSSIAAPKSHSEAADAPGWQVPSALFAFGLVPYVSTVKLPPLPSFWAEWLAVVLLICLLIALSTTRASEATPYAVPLVSLASAGFAVVVVLQLITNLPRFKGSAEFAIAECLLATLACNAAAKIRLQGRTAKTLHPWAWGLVIALLFNGAEVLAERHGWQIYIDRFIRLDPGSRSLGFFGQPNQLAVFAVVGWCAAVYLWLRGAVPSLLVLMAALVSGTCDAGAASRAGAILFMFASCLAWRATGPLSDRQRRRLWLLLSFAAFMMMQYLVPLSASTQNVTVLRADSAGRIELLRDSIALADKHPLIGVGFGNFIAARWTELSAPMSEPLSNHSHNAITQLAAELGVVAAILILAPIVYVLFRALQSCLVKDVSPEAFLIGSFLVVVAGYSLTEYPLWYTFFLLPFAFVSGLVEQPVIKLRPVQKKRMNVLRNCAWLLVVSVCVAVVIDYRRLQTIYTDATVQMQNMQPGGTLELPTREIRLIGLATIFDLQAELMVSRTLPNNGRLMADKSAITEKVMLAFPTWETVYRHIAFLVAEGKTREARQIWDKTERNADLRKETYEALQRQASNEPGLQVFFDTLPKPSVSRPIH